MNRASMMVRIIFKESLTQADAVYYDTVSVEDDNRYHPNVFLISRITYNLD